MPAYNRKSRFVISYEQKIFANNSCECGDQEAPCREELILIQSSSMIKLVFT